MNKNQLIDVGIPVAIALFVLVAVLALSAADATGERKRSRDVVDPGNDPRTGIRVEEDAD